jgi:HSP20 family protein
MAEVEVKKQKPKEEEREERGVARQSGFFAPWSPYGPNEFSSLSPFRMMRRMMKNMERAFGASGWPAVAGEETDGWWPAIEVSEAAGKLNVSADLPGIKPEDVKVEVTGDALVIQGERKREREESGRGYHRSERSYGHFYRRIPLPDTARTEEAQAEFRNGELKISIPVPESKTKRREIPVKAKQQLSVSAGPS